MLIFTRKSSVQNFPSFVDTLYNKQSGITRVRAASVSNGRESRFQIALPEFERSALLAAVTRQRFHRTAHRFMVAAP